jgi:uncharacterized protein (DUF302 family)
MPYYLARTITAHFADAIANVTASLKQEGFGVLSDIDVQATLKAKLGVDIPAYRILGACNPGFAHHGLQLEDKLGVLLPCNVIVRDAGAGQIEVAAVDPIASLEKVGNPDLASMAAEVRTRLQRALDTL